MNIKVNTKFYGFFLVFFSAVTYSAITLLVAQFKENYSINTYSVVFLKVFFAFSFSFFFCLRSFYKYLLDVKLILISLLYIITIFFFYHTIRVLGPDIATTTLFTYPFFVSVLNSIDSKKIHIKPFFISIVCVFGCYLVLASKNFSFENIGLLPFIAGLTYGLYIFFAGKFKYGTKIEHISVILFYGFIIFYCLFFTKIDPNLFVSIDANAFIILVLIGALSFLAALSLLNGIQRIGSNHAALISSFEPGITVIFSVVFAFSSFDSRTILGVSLIVLGNLIYGFVKLK